MSTHLQRVLLFCLLGLVGPLQAFYDSTEGRWLNRDPGEEEGGLNLYAYCQNDPANLVDPVGLDFIAVGGRRIVLPLGYFFGHLSLEFYEEKPHCTQEGVRFTSNKIPENAKKVAAVQLLPETSLFGHMRSAPFAPGGNSKFGVPNTGPRDSWSYDWISVIHFDSTADKLRAIYADSGDQKDAKKKWNTIMQVARSYAFAEQLPLGTRLRRWPNSAYGFAVGNNSNTFIRILARSIGKNADTLGGSYPGASRPSFVGYPGYTPARR